MAAELIGRSLLYVLSGSRVVVSYRVADWSLHCGGTSTTVNWNAHGSTPVHACCTTPGTIPGRRKSQTPAGNSRTWL